MLLILAALIVGIVIGSIGGVVVLGLCVAAAEANQD